MSFLKTISVIGLLVSASLLLNGCAQLNEFAGQAPTKNPEPITHIVKKSSVQCHNWCHDGWCSKHCEKNTSV